MVKAPPRLVVAAGGTGGHFYPGFAAAREFAAAGWQVLFMIRRGDASARVLSAAGFASLELDVRALPRSLSPADHFRFAAGMGGALAYCLRVFRDFRPAAALGTGSYVSFPALAAAALSGVPVFVHESNARFGLGNRLAGLFARKVLLGLPAGEAFAGKAALTGTPLREAFAAPPSREAARAELGLPPGAPVLLVFGGSQGSRALNSAAPACFKALSAALPGFRLLHVTGRARAEETRAAYAAAGLQGAEGLRLFDYFERMELLYAAADLAVSRSGSGSVTELVCLRKPALLVPLPSSAGGHQQANAEVLAAAGAARIVPEGPDFAARLSAAALAALGGPAGLAAMSAAFGKAGVPDPIKAAKAIFETVATEVRWK